jgi:hypothetical protein
VWQQKQVLYSALTLPRIYGEPEDEYVARIIEDAFKQVETAADLGTRVHKAIEDHFQGKPFDQELCVFVNAAENWCAENGVTFIGHEIRCVSPLGYAGTTDGLISVKARSGTGILDWKTRKSKPEYPMAPWSKEPMQIAAYADVKGASFGCNVFLSTTEPGRIEATWYDSDRLQKEMEAFRHVVKIWQHFNNYVPLVLS